MAGTPILSKERDRGPRDLSFGVPNVGGRTQPYGSRSISSAKTDNQPA